MIPLAAIGPAIAALVEFYADYRKSLAEPDREVERAWQRLTNIVDEANREMQAIPTVRMRPEDT